MDIGSSGELQIGRAKISTQLKSNKCFTKAGDLPKEDSRSQGKIIGIRWQNEGAKEQQVQVGGQVACQQSLIDLCGRFLPPFENVSF